jgi:hypothetical protein
MKTYQYRIMNEADDNEGGGSGGVPESKPKENPDYFNLKKEMDRKLANQSKEIQALINSQQQLIGTLTSKKQENTEVDADLSQLLFSEPEKALKLHGNKVAKSVKNEIMQELETKNKAEQRSAQIIQGLSRDFPELADLSSDLSMKSLEIYESLPDEDKISPLSYKIAVKEAAETLGILPKSKRKESDDSFSLGGTSRGGSPKRSNKVSEATLAFAEAMGLDTSKEEVVKNLTKRTNRNYSKYEGF